jgi:hypothetical protein
MKPQISYTDVVLRHFNYNLKKNRFVHFTITNHATGETRRKQFRGGINYYKGRQTIATVFNGFILPAGYLL